MSILFFNNDPNSLPADAQYYFNILVTCIAIRPDIAEDLLPSNIEEIWYLDKISDARPQAYHFYIEPELINDEEDVDWEMFFYPHCVVEVRENHSVCFYEMLDFDTEDLWRID